MTGSPFSWDKPATPVEVEVPSTGGNDYIDYSYAKYLGGHPLYTEPRNTPVYVYNDRIEIVNPDLIIPYSLMSRIENMDENKIDREKVVLGLLFFTPLAIHAAIKKKKLVYTVIRYMDKSDGGERFRNLGQTKIQDSIRHRDESGNITLVMDFGEDINRIQQYIYMRMLESKT
jgi:hypothetical protein